VDILLAEQIPILALCRVLAVATAFPILAGPGAPRMVRLGVSFALALILIPDPLGGAHVSLPPAATLLLLPFEILIGFAIGYAFSLVFHVLAIAGDFIGQEMGLNTASQIDPVTGRPAPVLARLFEALGLVLFVETGGFALMLLCIRSSFDLLPPGSLIDPGALTTNLSALTVDTIQSGVVVALPIALLLLLLTTFTTILARVLPKLHVFDFAYALRLMVALLLVSMLVPRLVPAVSHFGVTVAASLEQSFVAR